MPAISVIVGAGTYRGFNLTRDGTAAARITFQADPSAAPGSVIINQPNAFTGRDGINLEGASYVTIRGFTVTGQARAGIRSVSNEFVVISDNVADNNGVWGIFTGFSSDVRIENNQASRSQQQHGIYVSNSADRPIVRGNTVFENYQSGIQLNADASMGGDGIISGAVIENNIIRSNGAGGGASINLDGVQNSDIRNNVIDNARASGIALFRIDGGGGSMQQPRHQQHDRGRSLAQHRRRPLGGDHHGRQHRQRTQEQHSLQHALLPRRNFSYKRQPERTGQRLQRGGGPFLD